MYNWADWLQGTALSQYLQTNGSAFPWLECIHVIAVALVVGSIFIVDLRLLNLCSRSYRVSELLRTILPITIGAFVVAVITGFLMFSSQPAKYLSVTPFVLKMGLLFLAGINMAVFHMWGQRGIATWDEGDAIPLRARASGLFSLLLWIAILVCGRFIGFMLEYAMK